uniref:Uncharacterized protein n=1 Tax=Lactuca sativa TaxID=4236 RepID=A0A9R1V9E0_LACSA|nr:hypothetical protein LSAT_V11C600332560 [Lactuca sativa]
MNLTMLNEFFIQYDKAVESRRAVEEDEDFKTTNSRLCIQLKQNTCDCYTIKMFNVFKKEWTEATTNLTHETPRKNTEESTYRVRQLNVDKKNISALLPFFHWIVRTQISLALMRIVFLQFYLLN